jgi:hypothetical protein
MSSRDNRDERAARRTAEKIEDDDYLEKRREWLIHITAHFNDDKVFPSVFRDVSLAEKNIEIGDLVYFAPPHKPRIGRVCSVDDGGAVVATYSVRGTYARYMKASEIEIKRKASKTQKYM